jgi:1-acyl-sn-glycerol-3-phosphate acyltransferase
MRSVTGEILPFKDGLASIIIHCKITEVLPIYLGGVYNAWPKESLFPTFWKKITVVISKPLCMTEHKEWGAKEPRHMLTEYLKKRLVDLEKQYKDKYE